VECQFPQYLFVFFYKFWWPYIPQDPKKNTWPFFCPSLSEITGSLVGVPIPPSLSPSGGPSAILKKPKYGASPAAQGPKTHDRLRFFTPQKMVLLGLSQQLPEKFGFRGFL